MSIIDLFNFCAALRSALLSLDDRSSGNEIVLVFVAFGCLFLIFRLGGDNPNVLLA